LGNPHYKRWVETQGYYLRRHLHLSAYDKLDHLALAQAMKVKVLSVVEVPAFPQAIVHQLLYNDRDGWSAGCLRLPDGHELQALILYNPTHALTRQRATIMEELSHLYLKHKGSKIVCSDGCGFRSYKKSEESQAYFVGAAALLPADVMKKARTEKLSRYQVANHCIVSQDLVIFRENVTGIKLSQ
jgi:hypothetical protein